MIRKMITLIGLVFLLTVWTINSHSEEVYRQRVMVGCAFEATLCEHAHAIRYFNDNLRIPGLIDIVVMNAADGKLRYALSNDELDKLCPRDEQ